MDNSDVQRFKTESAILSEKDTSTEENLKGYINEIEKLTNISFPPGKIIYESFTDEELKEILVRAYHRLGRCPSQKEIFFVYRIYIRSRFGNWPWALQAAGLKPVKEYANSKKRKTYWRYFNKKNGGNSNGKGL